jgi:hypothetical protein
VVSSESSVDYAIEGRMVNPIEQMELDRIYEEDVCSIVDLNVLEKVLCDSIDENKLLMSLKLSGDEDRLFGFLKNKLVPNALFLKLLKLYNWQGEGFFDNDENRDVTAALIVRFYENIERNHNVQYANMGILHLLTQSDDGFLIETIASLSPIKTSLKEMANSILDNSTSKILELIAVHPDTPSSVIKRFIKSNVPRLNILMASRLDLGGVKQKSLISKETLSYLAQNPSLEQEVLELQEFEGHYNLIAKHIILTDEIFEKFKTIKAVSLAQNESVTLAMQNALLDLKNENVVNVLAQNSATDISVLERIFESSEDDATHIALCLNSALPKSRLSYYIDYPACHHALAQNSNTPENVLELLAKSDDVEVLLEVARNESTPVPLLYQLQLDKRLERAVKENASFGKNIQTENIGWLV